jgi:TonB family protein
MRSARPAVNMAFCLLAAAGSLADQAATGPQQTVCGKVTCASKPPHFTTLELKPKSKAPVTILSGGRTQFVPSPEEMYRDTEVCATGVVETYGRQRRLGVRGPVDVAIRKRLKPREPPWPGRYATECDEGVDMPVLIHEVRPNYTAAAMRARIVGIVALEAIVNADGTVGDLRVRRSLDSELGLDDEAIKAARQWHFKPGTRFGQPVPVLVEIEMSFRLK